MTPPLARPSAQRKCSGCGSTSHSANNSKCPNWASSQAVRQCSACGETGHSANSVDCPRFTASRWQRKCSSCGGTGHQANNRACPNYDPPISATPGIRKGHKPIRLPNNRRGWQALSAKAANDMSRVYVVSVPASLRTQPKTLREHLFPDESAAKEEPHQASSRVLIELTYSWDDPAGTIQARVLGPDPGDDYCKD